MINNSTYNYTSLNEKGEEKERAGERGREGEKKRWIGRDFYPVLLS